MEKILKATPEVENTSRRTGLQLGLAQVTEANTGDISVKLKGNRKRSVDEVIADVRAKIRRAEPVLDVEFPQLLQDMIGDLTSAPEPVVIKLFSQDPDLLEKWAASVGDTIKKIPGVVDVLNGIENTISGPATTFNVDQVVTARAGFSPQEVELDASAMLQGEPASAPVVVNDRSYTIRVRFPEDVRKTLDSIRQTMLVSGTGKTATIGTLASVAEIPGETEIRRDNLQRNVQVTARFENLNLGDGMKKVQEAIDDLHLPPSIRIEYGGGYAEQQESFKGLVFVLVLAIVLVFTVLLFEFGNFAAPVAVLSSALLSTCGVFVALLVTRTTFNLSSFMGLIMVIGIVAKNGILLLDADQKFRAAGMPAEESMIRAGERRLRPIMMTALATVAGMVPLALAVGRRLANAATPGHRGDRRHSRLDGPLAGGDSGRSLLHRRPGLRRRLMKKIVLAVALVIGAAWAAEGYKVITKIKIGGEGRWDYTTFDEVNRRLYVSHNTSVEVVDPDSGKVIGTIPQLHGVHGIAIANDLNRGFITNGSNTSNSVTIFDLKTLAKIGEPAAGKGPDAVCYEPKTKRVFAINHGGTDATAIDAKTGEVIKSFPTGASGEFCRTDGNGHRFRQSGRLLRIAADRRSEDGSHQAPVPCAGRRPVGSGHRREG